jgi:GxxExxY protein
MASGSSILTTSTAARRNGAYRQERQERQGWLVNGLCGGGTTLRHRGLHYEEPKPELDVLAHKVIGAAIEVHRVLGPGFHESVYENALCIELDLAAIPFERQRDLAVQYKGHEVGTGRIDILVDGGLIVELKAVDNLTSVHSAQVISYLKVSGCRLALLMNFNMYALRDGIKRVVLS